MVNSNTVKGEHTQHRLTVPRTLWHVPL